MRMRMKQPATWAAALLTTAATLAPGHGGATVLAGTLPKTAPVSFTPRTGRPTGSHLATGQLQLSLRVPPACAVAMPARDSHVDLADVRLRCSDGAVWLGNLVAQQASGMDDGAGEAFVPLQFDLRATGHVPRADAQPPSGDRFLAPRAGIRFNLDY
jgi:hypothetical protein